jgi:hypothetical protein
MKNGLYILAALAAMGVGALCFGTTLGRVWLVHSEHLRKFEKTPDLSKLFLDLDFWLSELEILLGFGIAGGALLVGALLLRDTIRNPEQALYELTFLAFPGSFIVYGLCGLILWVKVNLLVTTYYAVLSLPMLISLFRFYLPWIKNGPPGSAS